MRWRGFLSPPPGPAVQPPTELYRAREEAEMTPTKSIMLRVMEFPSRRGAELTSSTRGRGMQAWVWGSLSHPPPNQKYSPQTK